MATDQQVNILLVDDQPSNLLVLEAILEPLGQRLVRSGSGPQALRCLLDEDFALILMDAEMPGMDGFETAALIRQRDKSRYTPIIFLTAYDRTDMLLFKGYAVGAVDFIFKPLVPEVLRCKVSVFVELFRKSEEVKRQARLLREGERREHERELLEQKQRFEDEKLKEKIRLAREIQQRLFPAQPPRIAGLDIFGASYPAEDIGGDYFDYLPGDGAALGVAIGDVCGHGIGPALLMASTRAYLHALAPVGDGVGNLLGRANQALAADVAEGLFVTLFLARIDPRTGALTYSSAGHVPGFILGGDGVVKRTLESTSCPLGLVPGERFPEGVPDVLHAGDLIFLLTDGIIETAGYDQSYFGIDRALSVVRANRHRSAREIVQALYHAVLQFAQRQAYYDDLTALVIKVEDGSVAGV
jgi:serine phosphatase RsbU (regulator of sigma subunit)